MAVIALAAPGRLLQDSLLAGHGRPANKRRPWPSFLEKLAELISADSN
jgi:hypothetical protein